MLDISALTASARPMLGPRASLRVLSVNYGLPAIGRAIPGSAKTVIPSAI
jgi:hypothetical protein